VLGGLIVEGNGFDGALVRSVARERTGAVTGAARALTNLGGLWLDVLFVAAVAVLLGVRRRGDAAFVLLAGAGSMLLTNAIKLVLERPRPSGGLVAVSSYSWPSGHAASSIAFYGAMAVLAGRRAPSARLLIWGCLGLLVGVIGATRVYLGVHYPSDVVAGWVVGGLWLLAVVMLVGAPTTRGPPS
jgi:undecaprenyl-diphosphatase